MKNVVCVMLLLSIMGTTNVICSKVEINNATPLKIEANLDVIAYPDPKKTIGKHATVIEDVGRFFVRGINVGVHVGDHFIENILSECVIQTLGFGDVKYIIFTEMKKIGNIFATGEQILELIFYLVREPKTLFPGGIVSQSAPVQVRTKDFESFYVLPQQSHIVDGSFVQSQPATVNECSIQPQVVFADTVIR